MTEAMLEGGQALTFTRTRQAAELVHRYVQEALDSQPLEARQASAGLSRRLLADRTPRDRVATVQRQAARRGGHQCAGAGRRHRLARRGPAGRLSRHDRQHLATGRPQRPAARRKPGHPAGRQRPGRSIPDAAPAVLLRPVARARRGRSGEPLRAGQPLAGGGVRVAAVRSRRRTLRPVGHADRRRAGRHRHTDRGRRRVLFFRRAEPGPAREPAAHERQHVFDRAGARPTAAGKGTGGRPRSDRQRRRHQRPGAGVSRGRLPAQRRVVLRPPSWIWTARWPTSSGTRWITTPRPCWIRAW